MSREVCASDYGGPGDPTSGTHGYKGDLLTGRMAFAELDMGTALGNLPYKSKVRVTYNGKSIVAEKLDIGLGGGPCGGHARRIDLWWETAKALGFNGLGVVTVTTEDEAAGDKGGSNRENVEGLLEPFGGAKSPGALEGAVSAATGWTKDLSKILSFLDSSDGIIRVLKVVGGAILMLIAIDELSKISPGPSVNATGTAKKAAEAAIVL